MIATFVLMFSIMGIGIALGDIGDQKAGIDAAFRTFKAIDEGKQSAIDGLSKEGKRPEGSARGRIELRNVNFRYPSRPDVEVMHLFMRICVCVHVCYYL
jgi:hypothetical protein